MKVFAAILSGVLAIGIGVGSTFFVMTQVLDYRLESDRTLDYGDKNKMKGMMGGKGKGKGMPGGKEGGPGGKEGKGGNGEQQSKGA
jgi:hypothetical protein